MNGYGDESSDGFGWVDRTSSKTPPPELVAAAPTGPPIYTDRPEIMLKWIFHWVKVEPQHKWFDTSFVASIAKQMETRRLSPAQLAAVRNIYEILRMNTDSSRYFDESAVGLLPYKWEPSLPWSIKSR